MREKARVFILNLRNRQIFKAADRKGSDRKCGFPTQSEEHEEIVGIHGWENNAQLLGDGRTQIKPHLLRDLPKHRAVIIHCERGHRRKLLPPVEPNGAVCSWFG
jgi:hypothetical protein